MLNGSQRDRTHSCRVFCRDEEVSGSVASVRPGWNDPGLRERVCVNLKYERKGPSLKLLNFLTKITYIKVHDQPLPTKVQIKKKDKF